MIPSLANADAHRFSRRKFLGGSWLQRGGHDPITPRAAADAITILVQTRPDRLADAERAIAAIGSLAIRSRDPLGRLVVSPEAGADDIGVVLAALTDSPGVLSAALGGAELLQGTRP